MGGVQMSNTPISQKQISVLLISILVVALCGIAYELIIAAVSSYLIGNSVYQFSITIGFFMFAMGLGSYLSKFLVKDLVKSFVIIEIAISIVGGVCSLLLFISFSYVNTLYSPLMYLLILLIGTMVGLEIPVLTRILSEREDIKSSLAKVLSIDYVGALIGSVIFPLLLLPHLGLIRSSFAIGLINILTAFINVYFFRDRLGKPVRWVVVTGGITLTLIVLIAMGSRLSSYAEKMLYSDNIIYKEQTPYQRIVFTRNNINNEHRMYIDGHVQFSEKDEYRYHEALVHPVMTPKGRRENILILGGGDGLAAREVLKYDDVKLIHLVDIDPAITNLASTFPRLKQLNKNSLSDPRLKIFNEDAFIFINKKGVIYDRVIIDMPDPHNEVLNKLYSKEFYTMIKRRMDSNGYVVSQSTSPFFARRTFWCINRTLDEVFSKTHSYHITIPAFGIWGFNIASVSGDLPDSYNIEVKTKYLSKEIMQSASIFGKDISRVEMPVNTIHEPKLYIFYIQDLQS